jgi:PPK2 family polyphosphate:nucleotide phosphotransferase
MTRLMPLTARARPALRDRDAHPPAGAPTGRALDRAIADQTAQIAKLQRVFYADARHALLIVLQGRDAAGKDGTIRHVFGAVNPQGCEVTSFKQPTALEQRHDYLWRVHRHVPALGMIGIFNRSHYEEVLVVRVHPEVLAAEHMPGPGEADIWERRYREINDWERYLKDNGIHVVKVMLNLSKGEQARRFLKRIDHPEKNWKFSPADIRERQYWDSYQLAFEHMLSSTSTEWAPWYVVPADHKWFSRLATAAVLVRELAAIDPRYPAADPAVRGEMLQARAGLVAELGTDPDGGGDGTG